MDLNTVKALIVVAHGCEEIETIATYDLLKRAHFDVKMAALEEVNKPIIAAHGLCFYAKVELAKVFDEDFDIIILPGGLPGSEYLRDSDLLLNKLKKQQKDHKWIAAICAAPGYVLGTHNLVGNAKVTSYPGTEKLFKTGTYENQGIVVDSENHLITAQGPAFANAFGLAIIANLENIQAMNLVAEAALINTR